MARLGEHLGGVDRLLAILENLQVPLAEVRERLGIPGLSVQAAHHFRDKAAMKTVFEQADPVGAPPAGDDGRGRRGVRRNAACRSSKPLAGSGARSTFRIEDQAQLDGWLSTARLSDDDPAMLEEFLVGAEHSSTARPSTASCVALDRPLPADAAQRPREPMDPVVRPAPRHIDEEPFLQITDVGVAPSERSVCTRASRTWSGSGGPTARSPSPRSAPARLALSS